jgi:hypothetical protein
MKYVFLIQKWIDPNVRTTKAWIPGSPSTFAEMAAYSYSSFIKIGRGGRLIALAAGRLNFEHGY